MATYTDNYQLTKPTYAEQADIGVINSNMNKIDEVMHSSQISLADAYDSTQTYAEGDVVMYELLMYKCISPTTGVWDGSKWERTTASESGGGGSAELDILGEASGAVASFADGASAGLAKCIADITPVQDLHGYDKPWAGGTGKNKCPNPTDGTYNGVTVSTSNGIVEFSGTATQNTSIDYFRNVSGLPEGIDVGNQYTISIDTNNVVNVQVLYSTNNSTFSELISVGKGHSNNTANFTLPSNTTGMLIRTFATQNAVIEGTAEIMLRLSTESSDFEPYANICPISGHSSVTVTVSDGNTSTTKTTALGQTVYGGQLNVLTGELTVTHEIVDLGSLNGWSDAVSNLSSNTSIASVVKAPSANTEAVNGLCDSYLVVARTGITSGQISVQANGNIVICDDTITGKTSAEIKTYLNGVNFLYELATPQTVQLTPQEVRSILGQNYISADTGDIDIVYVKASAPIQPNPTGTPTATLNKLGIEGTVFEVPSGGGGSSSGINYSTTEQVIGTWIDGKPLYQKTYDFGALPNNATKTLSSGLIDANVVKMDGIAISANGFITTIPHPEISGNGNIQIDFLATKEIRIKTNSDYSTFTGYVTLQYTKITD